MDQDTGNRFGIKCFQCVPDRGAARRPPRDQRHPAFEKPQAIGHVVGMQHHDDAAKAREGGYGARQDRPPGEVAPLLWQPVARAAATARGHDHDGCLFARHVLSGPCGMGVSPL